MGLNALHWIEFAYYKHRKLGVIEIDVIITGCRRDIEETVYYRCFLTK